ncbi:MAG: DUF2207 domain-containing protein [bacterium]
MGYFITKIRDSISVGIYWRKLFFFVGIFVVSLFTYNSVTYFKADSQSILPNSYSANFTEEIKIESDGFLTINGKKTTEKVSLQNGYDELRLPVVDRPPQDISLATITVIFPKQVSSEISHETLGVHGVGEHYSYTEGANKIVFVAKDISVYGTFSIITKMPKGFINPPIYIKIISVMPTLDTLWLILGISLPVITFFLMLFFIIKKLRSQRVDLPKNELTAPPIAIPPAVVGVLYRQKVGSREIAATLVDLARRGDIAILDRERDFGFAKNKLDKRLIGFEKILMSKIFKIGVYSNQEIIDQQVNNHLYSRKISLVSAGVYLLATRLGYFRANPQAVYAKYAYYGFGTFMVGLAGFVLSLWKFSNTSYISILWVGVMLSSLIVTFMIRKMPVRTEVGNSAIINWLSFRNYLSNPEKIKYSPDNQEIFQKYLPYAIALECEVDWAKRFSDHNFVLPEWYITEKIGLGLEDFCLSLFPIVSYVSRSFAAIREPGFR